MLNSRSALSPNTMSTVASRIIGWSPPDNEDFVDVPGVPGGLLPLQNPTFHISEPNPVRRLRRTTTGIFHAASPASSTSEHSSDESPGEKRVDTNGKNTDPAWVARPRNEFILFRCDYVRKHSREGKRVRRAPGAEAEKTLSKQAAEAWHHLPPEERLYWKERANGERNEHARRYPDYRYRPKKSATGRRRQARCSPSKLDAPTIEKITHSPIPDASTASEQYPPRNASFSITHQVSTSSKGTPRRYASVPQLGAAEPGHRRLRSTASAGWIGVASSSAEQLDFASSSREFAPMPRLADEAAFAPSDYICPEYAPHAAPRPTGPVLLSSSSLLNWNGARMVSAPLQATQFLSSTSVSVSPLPSLEMVSTHALSEYTTGGNPEPPSGSQMFGLGAPHYTTQGDLWMSQLQYPSEHDAGAELQYPSEHDAGAEAPPISVRPDLLSAHAPQEPASSASAGSNHMYGASGGTIAPQIVTAADYGMLPGDSIPGGLLHSETGAAAENLFAMDTDEFFNPNY